MPKYKVVEVQKIWSVIVFFFLSKNMYIVLILGVPEVLKVQAVVMWPAGSEVNTSKPAPQTLLQKSSPYPSILGREPYI